MRQQARARILLVYDGNLPPASPQAYFYGRAVGHGASPALFVHYTPKHGSWLNQAEREPSMFSRQFLGKRRIEDIAPLRKQARAWNRLFNKDKATIQWKFTRQQARTTLHYTITRSKH